LPFYKTRHFLKNEPLRIQKDELIEIKVRSTPAGPQYVVRTKHDGTRTGYFFSRSLPAALRTDLAKPQPYTLKEAVGNMVHNAKTYVFQFYRYSPALVLILTVLASFYLIHSTSFISKEARPTAIATILTLAPISIAAIYLRLAHRLSNYNVAGATITEAAIMFGMGTLFLISIVIKFSTM
jgi:hypothetical protein